jgi:hypothetical protein
MAQNPVTSNIGAVSVTTAAAAAMLAQTVVK